MLDRFLCRLSGFRHDGEAGNPYRPSGPGWVMFLFGYLSNKNFVVC